MQKFPYKFIAIEGVIGAGKTTLATEISKLTNAQLLLERFEKNPFLIDFYKDQDKFALETENFFLNDRFIQLKEFFETQPSLTIADFSIHKSLVFSNLTLNEYNKVSFRKSFEEFINKLKMPDLIIYLKNNSKEAKDRIIKRGRLYEQQIQEKYLLDLELEYELYWKSQIHLNVLQINVDNFQFPYKTEDISKLLNYLKTAEIKGFKQLMGKDLE
jgi:deoxyguanosine kinase